MSKRALIGADIFDGKRLHQGRALVLDDGRVHSIPAVEDVPTECDRVEYKGGTILPGFVDLQVNGGGGVMFNDQTSLDGLRAISSAHLKTGTRAFLPTLITDTPKRTRLAVDAVEQAIKANVAGIIGIHLEGPHLSVARKGAHDPTLIRKMEQADEDFLVQTAARLANVMVTVAPENVTPAQINRLSKAGIIVSLGHTDCSYEMAQVAFASGARCVTHLFNAMSQISNREPGLVGAALGSDHISAGLIADGIHVHGANIKLALDAKRAPGEIFLVSDAMSPVGSEITEFQLNGRRVLRADGRLVLEDGTLAGADLTLARAISVLVQQVGVMPEHAFRMATSVPAHILNKPQSFGHFTSGAQAHAIWMDDRFDNIIAL